MQASNHGDKFSYVAMRDFAKFMTTRNSADQTIAVDGSNVYNIQSTGTGIATANGIFILELDADAELLIITDQVFPTTAWAANVAQVVGDEVYTGTTATINQMAWKCLVAHTTSGDKSPVGGRNNDLWQAIPNADTLSMIQDATCWFMITAETDLGTQGKLGLWIASEALGVAGAAPTLKVPYFDPAMYCVVAFADVEQDEYAGTGVVGAALATDGGVDWDAAADAVYHPVLGPVLPHPDNMPKN